MSNEIRPREPWPPPPSEQAATPKTDELSALHWMIALLKPLSRQARKRVLIYALNWCFDPTTLNDPKEPPDLTDREKSGMLDAMEGK